MAKKNDKVMSCMGANEGQKKITETLQSWKFMRTLPRELHGFSLQIGGEHSGAVEPIFTYYHPGQQRRLTVLYDGATEDFAVRIAVGLTEYIDPDFIAPDLPTLERLLDARLSDTLAGLVHFQPKRLGSIFNAKKIVSWPVARQLPREYAGFTLFINPAAPVKVLNGSFIIIDYSDFAAASNFVVYYNILRDEFFGERRLARRPELLTTFDAKTLPELAQRLKDNLAPTLEDLRRRVAQLTATPPSQGISQ